MHNIDFCGIEINAAKLQVLLHREEVLQPLREFPNTPEGHQAILCPLCLPCVLGCLLAVSLSVCLLSTTRFTVSTDTEPRRAMIEHRYADVNGVRLHYATAGRGKLILFLHGFPEFWYAWKQQLSEFARDYQAVAPDLRGYNLSSKPAEVEQYAVTHLVEDVRALAAHLGHSRFILVGHDWGGAVAWATALYHPEAVENLIIINAPHPGIFERELRSNPAQQQASQYMLFVPQPAGRGHAFGQQLRESGGSSPERGPAARLLHRRRPRGVPAGVV